MTTRSYLGAAANPRRALMHSGLRRLNTAHNARATIQSDVWHEIWIQYDQSRIHWAIPVDGVAKHAIACSLLRRLTEESRSIHTISLQYTDTQIKIQEKYTQGMMRFRPKFNSRSCACPSCLLRVLDLKLILCCKILIIVRVSVIYAWVSHLKFSGCSPRLVAYDDEANMAVACASASQFSASNFVSFSGFFLDASSFPASFPH